MMKNYPIFMRPMLGALAATAAASSIAATLNGQVQGGGAPIAGSTVTLFAAGTGAPRQLAQARSGADGRFTLTAPAAPTDSSLYLVAQGGQPAANKSAGNNPAIALMTVLGAKAPDKVTINEMTTVASVWTHNQFISGSALSGPALSLGIAAGNVPSFVDLQTGGWGTTIQDPLNSGQTPTMANFATLANALSSCVTQVTADACGKLFAASTSPKGVVPANTLAAAHSIAQSPGTSRSGYSRCSNSIRFLRATRCAPCRSCPT
jgi:hypothetical protein